MVGNVPDYDATLAICRRWRKRAAPTHRFIQPVYAGRAGFRGLCSAPLLAEILAAQMSDEPLPLDRDAGGAESESAVGEKTAEGKSGEIR
jgi:tRNA 5-methylaminomethyl-2-thiouridine biosynthesis bifunctional protein